ncbi:hypothetical protein EDD22DRAFT_989837 [Suillus occidentalis]|nr:hypothetical protein EDD22DRAFT_989837 [Suillus occidentalis]
MYILWIARCAVTELNNPAMTCLATGTLNRSRHEATVIGPIPASMTAKRYYTSSSDPQGLTLLFAHGIGAHKEHWEPMLRTCSSKCIREAWCFDWLNHGDAAVINKTALKRRSAGDVSIAEWAAAIASFVKSPFLRNHRLVGLGHSAGPRHPNYYRKRKPWAGWNHEVFDIFTQYGFTQLVHKMAAKGNKVTLKCDLLHEALAYQDIESHFEATDQYTRLCCVVPVHIVFGTIPDYM